jgi:predicted Zn-dependent peptidase
MVIAMSGDFDVDEALALLGDHFQAAPSGELMSPTLPREPALTERRVNHAPRKTGQTHLILGWPTAGMRHPDSYVLKVIERILGAGADSRLYRELRERRGLVYSVRAIRAEHAGLGHFSIYTATDPKSTRMAIAAILLEIRRLRADLLSEEEIEAAKASYEGSLAVSFETNLRMAGIIGVETLLMGRFEPFEEAARRVRTVSAADVVRVARTYFDRDRYALASLGPEAPGDTV